MRDMMTRKPSGRRTTAVTPRGRARVPSEATTSEKRENELIALAVDLAEEQLRAGTASSQVITHFLKLATEKEKLEREKLEAEIEITRTKKKSIEASDRMEELLANAINVFTSKYEWQGDDTGSEG